MLKKKLKKEKNNVFSIIYEILLYIYMLFVPVFIISTNVFSEYFNTFKTADTIMWFSIFICIITFVIIVTGIIKGKKPDFSNIKVEMILLVMFISWCYISTLFSIDIKDSLLGVSVRYCGLIQFLSYFMFGYLGYSLNDKGRLRVLRLFLSISTIIAILSILQYHFSVNILPLNSHSSITGIFYNSNHYGYYIVYSTIISIFLFLYDKNKILKSLNFIIYILNIYLLIINNTFGCYIAVLLSIILLFFYILKTKRIKNYLYLFIIIPFILLSVFVNDNGYYYEKENFHELLTDLNIIVDTPVNEDIVEEYDPIWEVGNYRGSLWLHGIKYSLEKPAFGYGLENSDKRYSRDGIDIGHSHNLIINLTTTIGIPGMLFYISGLIIVLIKLFKNMKKENIIMNMCCFIIIAHLISSMFGVTIYYVTVYFIIILGMALKFLTEVNKD